VTRSTAPPLPNTRGSRPPPFTARPAITAAYLAEHHPGARCLLLNSGDIGEDLAGVTAVDDDDPEPDVVVIGGAGAEFSYAALNRVFAHLQNGARLVAMHATSIGAPTRDSNSTRARSCWAWNEPPASRQVLGKPADAFFTTTLAALEVSPSAALMVGDDIEADVLAAQRNGITGGLVKTGKYLPETHPNAH
jgi:ribonucleotide monophosphatase NagD (HAD superfamily)